jgi:hypothetical protein
LFFVLYTIRVLSRFALSRSCADVSNPAKIFHVYEKWANLVMEEFYQQGDLERELKLPISPFYDRNNQQMAKCQIGFIKFIVRPLYTTFTELATSLRDEILNNLNVNQNKWENRMNQETIDEKTLPTSTPKKALKILGSGATTAETTESDDIEILVQDIDAALELVEEAEEEEEVEEED